MMLKLITPIVALAGCGLAIAMVMKRGRVEPPPLNPPVLPAESPFATFVAAPGLTEASTENISIGTPTGGIVLKVHVKVGDTVKIGEALFELDDRNTRAKLLLQQAALQTTESQVRTAMASLDEAREQFGFLDRISDKRAISGQSLASRRSQVAIAEAKLEEAKSGVSSAKAEIVATEIELEQLTVRAPVDGLVLQVRTRPGEFATTGVLNTPLILLGNIDQLHVRVDVDEDNAWRIREGAAAVAHVRGNKEINADLQFVRFEPFIVPKQSLTGSATERVDTRVLQVVYRFERGTLPIFVGQQMDVFIDASPPPTSGTSND